jgi:hypothetical protein
MRLNHQYHFFISYRWSTYPAEAALLRRLIADQGYTCWLDSEHPFLIDASSSKSADQQLGLYLRAAMQRCEYVLFFETNTELMLQIGGSPVRHVNWQERELSMAEASRIVVLYHSANPSVLGFGEDEDTVEYDDLTEALNIVLKKLYRD